MPNVGWIKGVWFTTDEKTEVDTRTSRYVPESLNTHFRTTISKRISLLLIVTSWFLGLNTQPRNQQDVYRPL